MIVRRPDQYEPVGAPALGAGFRGGILRARTVIIQGAGGGEFVYDASGNLRIALVGATTTDPLQGLTCQAGQSFWNGHGAVLFLISSANDALFGYFDNASAVQGGLVFADGLGGGGTDPVTATAYSAGQTIIDPVFGDSLNTIGSSISFQIAGFFTQVARINVQQGSASGPVQPAIYVFAPERGVSGHLAVLIAGTSSDGTQPAQMVLANAATGFVAPVPVSKALLEDQGSVALINAALPAFVSTAWQASSVAGVLTGITGSGGLSGAVPLSQGDGTVFAGITGTGGNPASKAWSIPANDANVNTIYRLTVWGFGTEGTTNQNLLVGLALNGANVRTVTATGLGISQPFRFKIRIELHIKTTGAGGTAELTGDGTWATTATPTVDNSFAAGSSAAGGEAFNTTIGNTMSLQLGWAATTGAPTITTLGSLFERLGP